MHVCICANGKKYTSRILKRTDIKLRWSVHDGPCVSPGAERPTSSHAPLGRHRTTDSISQDAIHPVPGRLQSRGAQSPLGGEVPGRPRASWRKRGPKCLWLLCIGGGRASGGALWLCEQTAAKPLATINQPSVSVLDISCKWDHTIGLPDSKPDAISKLEQWEDPWTVERDAPRGPGQEGAVYNQQERVDSEPGSRAIWLLPDQGALPQGQMTMGLLGQDFRHIILREVTEHGSQVAERHCQAVTPS
ncbi:uncharacterized protein [Equus przewalskii]|uniref:Uncharacterized protein isoform X3 n=1 Tax=Equus przewalskii TaxID=9798 RepID=A0ABM4JG98_EQUPR